MLRDSSDLSSYLYEEVQRRLGGLSLGEEACNLQLQTIDRVIAIG
jgi:hypothetical protein